MAIRVRGANRKFTSEKILNAYIGRPDPYGNPFELIHLDWNNTKKVGHGTRTKGDFDDVMLTRGQRGVVLEYRSPGSLEWLRDGLTGYYSAQCAKTEKNMRLLASMYYDKLWTIKEVHIRQEVEKMADAIDENNKKVKMTHTIVTYEQQPNGTNARVQKEITESVYDFHVRRRKAHLKGPRGEGSIMSNTALETQQGFVSDNREAELNKKEVALQEKEALLNEKLKKLNMTPPPERPKVEEILTDQYTREDLEKLVPVSKLRKLARDEFGVKNSFDFKAWPKEKLIDHILEQQMEPTSEGAVVN